MFHQNNLQEKNKKKEKGEPLTEANLQMNDKNFKKNEGRNEKFRQSLVEGRDDT